MHVRKMIRMIFPLGIFIFCGAGCSKMNDYHDKYLRDGEKIYARKIDSVKSIGGDGRLALYVFNSDDKTDRLLCYWDEKSDSLTFNMAEMQKKDGAYILLIGDKQSKLPEKSYVFQLYTVDKAENRSVATEVVGEVYGDRYKQSLNNRIFHEVTYDAEQAVLTFEWGASLNTDEVGVQLYYYDAGGKLDSIRMDPASNLIELEEFSIKKPFYYQTLYQPDLLSLDTFYSQRDTVSMEF